jgi:hypothetical protein
MSEKLSFLRLLLNFLKTKLGRNSFVAQISTNYNLNHWIIIHKSIISLHLLNFLIHWVSTIYINNYSNFHLKKTLMDCSLTLYLQFFPLYSSHPFKPFSKQDINLHIISKLISITPQHFNNTVKFKHCSNFRLNFRL